MEKVSFESTIPLRDIPANDDGAPGAREFAVSFNEKFGDLLEYLTALGRTDTRSINEVQINVRKTEMKTAKDTELIGWLMGSDRFKWNAHPSFYHALIRELTARDLLERFRINL